MRTPPWERPDRIRQVRDRIWSYVSPAVAYSDPGVLDAAALLGWAASDIQQLGNRHFLLCAEAGELIDAMPSLTRRLRPAITPAEEVSHERLLGPVQWGRTYALRAASGSGQLHVTAPPRRAYQTRENELLAHVIDGIVHAGADSGWPADGRPGTPAARIAERHASAEYWQQHHALRQVQRVPPTPRTAAAVAFGRFAVRYAPAVRAYERMRQLVEDLDRTAVREAVEQTALVTASNPTLFELLTTFSVLEALAAQGWRTEPFTTFQGALRVHARHADGRTLTLHYQSVPPGLASSSRYQQTLHQHGIPGASARRPDIVLEWAGTAGPRRWLLIECKLYQDDAEGAARAALADLLGYRREFGQALAPNPQPYGLGVVWGAGLEPAAGSEVLLCTPDQLAPALQLALH
ncbi:hypothetical protein [Motilibacter aurantiacus]|uniref:hypothetical protein n=1 Tax=Motilibacter aurantiacus TaxID=2714955 RepID=UPI00140944D5|nr:hypothetical protein [Motilibacter aurantiacus]NHC46742.1 hypothetical protein [Motilibacter aurantiacus]